jgi:hypothetical protein
MEDNNIYPILPDRLYTLRYDNKEVKVMGDILIAAYIHFDLNTPDLSRNSEEFSTDK